VANRGFFPHLDRRITDFFEEAKPVEEKPVEEKLSNDKFFKGILSQLSGEQVSHGDRAINF